MLAAFVYLFYVMDDIHFFMLDRLADEQHLRTNFTGRF